MGILNYIRHNLPESWDYVLTKKKIKTEVCMRIYKNIPRQYCNRYEAKRAICAVKKLLNASSIIYAINSHMDNPQFWYEVDSEIKKYEDQCR